MKWQVHRSHKQCIVHQEALSADMTWNRNLELYIHWGLLLRTSPARHVTLAEVNPQKYKSSENSTHDIYKIIFPYFVAGCCLLTGLTKQEKHYKYYGGQRLQEWGHFPSLKGSNYCCAPKKCPQTCRKQVLTIHAFTSYVWTTVNVCFDISAIYPMSCTVINSPRNVSFCYRKLWKLH